MQRNHSRRLHKAPELNVAWYLKNKHLQGSRDHLAKVGPEGAHPRPIGLVVGPVGPPGPEPPHLLECSSTAYENQSKPHV
jgi:hypothetical protein